MGHSLRTNRRGTRGLTYSASRGRAVEHVTWVNDTGHVFCSCEDFCFRKAKHQPTVYSPAEHLCKHALQQVYAYWHSQAQDLGLPTPEKL